MWEKIRVVFTIPELRQKILLTLALPGHLPHRLVDSAADRRSRPDDRQLQSEQQGLGGIFNRSPCSAPRS